MTQPFTTAYTGLPTHCCLMMDMALDEGYLYPTLVLNFEASKFDVLAPHIEGARLTKTGRKRKPNLLVNYCPWCGKKLSDDK